MTRLLNMISVTTIDKNNNIKTEKIKDLKIEDLFKKAKFRKNDKFDKRATWNTEGAWVSIYAKIDGRGGTENKYELPPPVDKDLFFGTMVIIKHKNEVPKNKEIVNFTKEEWLKVYEKCMGGFEDLGEDDSEEDEEEIPEHLKTKSGYMKDGFVVEDKEEEVEEEEEEEEYEEEGEEEGEEEEEEGEYEEEEYE